MSRFERIESSSDELNNADVSKADNAESFDNSEDYFDYDELEYLDKNTDPNSDECPLCDSSDLDYSEEELQELYEDFAGYINEDVRFEYDGRNIDSQEMPSEFGENYKQTGLHRVSWSEDSVEGTEENILLPAGTRIIQYSHEGASGRYFAPEGSDYSDLQLADSDDKRILNTYEVLQKFPVSQSAIAKQYFNSDEQPEAGSQIQYRSEFNADELERAGILKKVSNGSGD